MKILGVAVISAIATGAIVFTGGCETQVILRDRPLVPAPSNQEPSSPSLAAPVIVKPIDAQPALHLAPSPAPAPVPAVAKPSPAPVDTVVPK